MIDTIMESKKGETLGPVGEDACRKSLVGKATLGVKEKKCMAETPAYVEMEPGHFVACHRAEELTLRGFCYE